MDERVGTKVPGFNNPLGVATRGATAGHLYTGRTAAAERETSSKYWSLHFLSMTSMSEGCISKRAASFVMLQYLA